MGIHRKGEKAVVKKKRGGKENNGKKKERVVTHTTLRETIMQPGLLIKSLILVIKGDEAAY